MTHEEFNNFCRALAHTTYVVQWGNAHVWKIGGKVFALGVTGPDGEPAFTFKTSELDFNLLKDEPGFRPAPYMASRGLKWIQQFSTDPAHNDELQYYLQESYRMVSLGLTKKLQKELGLNQV